MAVKTSTKKSPRSKIKESIASVKGEVKQAFLIEATPSVGNPRSEDVGWRSLTETVNRDLNVLVQSRMQEIAFYLYDSDPLAHRILEIMRSFVVGDGFKFMAKDPKVQDILMNFWNDPDNNWEMKQGDKALELGLWGEQCYPVFVNKYNGDVKLGYLDPGVITKIKQDKDNPEEAEYVEWEKRRKKYKLKVVRADNAKRSSTHGRLMGECFYFAVNKVAWSSRGRSDLLCLADWIDGFNQFLFARLERAFYLNTFVWDVLCEGMGKKEIEEFAKNLRAPKPGSMRIHNEKIKWNIISSKLESDDASNEAKMFRNQILGGAGFPGHWFGEGENTTRATAVAMSAPTLKHLRSRQRYFKNIIMRIFRFVLDQKIIHGMLDKNTDCAFAVFPSPIISRDAQSMANSLDKFSSAMKTAVDNEWIRPDTAKRSFHTFMTDLGVDIQELEQISREQKNYKKAPSADGSDEVIEDDKKKKKDEEKDEKTEEE